MVQLKKFLEIERISPNIAKGIFCRVLKTIYFRKPYVIFHKGIEITTTFDVYLIDTKTCSTALWK